MSGDEAAVSALLEAGADHSQSDADGRTPAHHAAMIGSARALECLLCAGASTHAADNMGWTPLHDAAHSGNRECAMLLLAAGANPTARSLDGNLPFNVAEAGASAIEMSALALGRVDPRVEDLREFAFLLSEAKPNPEIDLMMRGIEDERLFAQTVEREIRRAARGAELVGAAESGDAGKCARLISEGANPDARNLEGFPCLAIAAGKGHTSTADLLLSAGADLEAQGPEGIRAIHAACMAGSEKTADLLLGLGCDPRAATEGGSTALHMAVEGGHAGICRALVSRGASTSAKDAMDWSPAEYATVKGRPDCLGAMAEGRKAHEETMRTRSFESVRLRHEATSEGLAR